MLKSLIRKLSLSALLVCVMAFFILWMDAWHNSGGLIKNLAETALSRKGVIVSIDRIIPSYLQGRFTIKGLSVNFQDSAFLKIGEANCLVSLSKGFFGLDFDIDAMDMYAELLENSIYYQKVHSFCSFDMIRRKLHISLSEEQSKKLADFKIEPTNFFAFIDIKQENICIKGTLKSIFDKNENFYRIYSQGNADVLNLSVAKCCKLLNLPLDPEGVLSFCEWEFNYIDTGKKDFCNLRDLKLRTALLGLKSGKNSGLARKILTSLNLDQEKIVGTFCFEGSREKIHEICLDRKNGQIQGSGLLHQSISPFLEGCLPFIINLENLITNVTLGGPLKWHFFADLNTKDFAWTVNTQLSKARLKIKKCEEFIQNANVAIAMQKSKLDLKISGIAQNFGARFECSSLIQDEGVCEAKINFVMLRSFKIGDFAIESGCGVINLNVNKCNDCIGMMNARCDLTNLAFCYEKMSLAKKIGDKALLDLNGKISEDKGNIIFSLIGNDNLGVDGSCEFDEDNILLNLSNICYGLSSYSAHTKITAKHVSTLIKGEILDLRNANLLEWLKPEFYKKSLELNLSLDFIFMRNEKTLNQVRMHSFYNGKHYTRALFKGSIGGDTFVNLMLQSSDAKNAQEEWVFTTNNAGSVVSALGIYDGMNFGTLKIDFITDRSEISQNNVHSFTSGKLTLTKFNLKDSPHPLVALLCPSNLVRPFVDKYYTVFDSLTARFYIDKGLINIEKAYAKSISHDCFIRDSQIAPDGSSMKLRGEIAPSWYGIGNIVRSIPILGGVVDRIRFPGLWLPYRVNIVF